MLGINSYFENTYVILLYHDLILERNWKAKKQLKKTMKKTTMMYVYLVALPWVLSASRDDGRLMVGKSDV